VRGVLLLRRIQSDLEVFFLFVDIEGLAEGLIALGDDLDEDLSLRDGGDAGLAFLIAAEFEGGADGFAEFDDGVALDEADDYAGMVDGLAGLVLEDDIDFGHGGGGHGDGDEAGEQDGGHNKGAERAIPIEHTSIINVLWGTGGRMGV
jgi:hypothetical protein